MKKNTPTLKPSVDHIQQINKRPTKDTQLQLRIDTITKTKWSHSSKVEGYKSLSKYVIDTVNDRVDNIQ